MGWGKKMFRIRLRYFLRRFKKTKTKLLLSAPAVFGVIWWFLSEIFKDWFFGSIREYITGRGVFAVTLAYIVAHPILIPFIIAGVTLAGILIWIYLDTRKEVSSNFLTNTLTEMHKRLIEIKNQKLSKMKKIERKQVEDVIPILLNNLGVISLSNYNKWESNAQRRIKRHMPNPGRKIKKNWYIDVLGAASQISKELFEAKDWSIDDLVTVGEWLDRQHWGVGELRENDNIWNSLYESIQPYMLDGVLREQITKHVSYSYGACSILLTQGYSMKWPDSPFSSLLHTTLIGNATSKVEIDTELSKPLSDIDKRLKILMRSFFKNE